MAKKAKSRTIMVRLISMAMTGYYRTLMRPRAHQPLSMMKYDPIGTILKTPLLRRYAGAYVSWRTRRRLQEITRPVVGIGSWVRKQVLFLEQKRGKK